LFSSLTDLSSSLKKDLLIGTKLIFKEKILLTKIELKINYLGNYASPPHPSHNVSARIKNQIPASVIDIPMMQKNSFLKNVCCLLLQGSILVMAKLR
jgi:hypothetical protein